MVTQNVEEIERLELRLSEIDQQIDIAEQMGMNDQVAPLTEESDGIEAEIEDLGVEDEEEENEEGEEEENEEIMNEEIMMEEDEEEAYIEEEYEEEEEYDEEEEEAIITAAAVLVQAQEQQEAIDPMDPSQYDQKELWPQVTESVMEEYGDEAMYKSELKKGEYASKQARQQMEQKIKAWHK
jgi:exosome complex component RRP41